MNVRCANTYGCPNIADPVLSGRCEPCAAHLYASGYDRTPDLMPELPSTTDVCKITGLTFRQVDYIDRSGKVSPTVRAVGSGTQRGWTLDDVTATVVANLAMQHRLDLDPRHPPPFITIRPGVLVRLDVTTIRDELLERWPAGKATDLPGRPPESRVA